MNFAIDLLRSNVSRRPGAVAAAIVLLSILFGFLGGQAQEADGDISLSTGSEPSIAAERIDELFASEGSPVLAQVIVTSQDVLSPAGLEAATSLRGAILSDPTISPLLVVGPDGAPGVTTWVDAVLMAAAQQGVDPATLDDASIDALHANVLSSLEPAQAAQFALLVSEDTDAGMIVAMLDPDADRAAMTAALLAFGDLTVDGPVEVHPFNFELLNAESQSAVETQMGQLLLLAMALIVLILVAINRNVVDVVTAVVGLVFSIIWMQGIGALLGPGFLGITDGMGEMSMAIPILLVGLGVDYGIHLSSRYREERVAGQPPAEAAGNAIGAVGTALTLATITTVVGFLTNLANPLAPLQDFGLLAAVGVISAFVIMTAFVPAVRLLTDQRFEKRTGRTRIQGVKEGSTGPGALGRIAGSVETSATHRPVAVLAVAGALTLGAGLAATGLSTEFSQTEFFPEDSQALATITLLNDEFGGDLAETTRVLVQGDVAGNAAALDAFVASLADNPDVRTVEGQPQVQATTTPDGTAAVVAIQTQAGEAVDRLEADLRTDAAVLESAGLDIMLTSENLLITAVMDDLRDSQVSGLLLTLFASMVILAGAFWARRRAPMLGVLAIASVGLVTVWVLGVMALTGIPFNMMTAMISALAIGIGVPFGIHVVNRFLEEREVQPTAADALRQTLEQTGGALVGSALTTVAGFGVLSLSTIGPMRQFGIVIAMTIAFALVSSVVVLPAMLTLWDRRSGEGDGATSGQDDLAPASDREPAGVR